MTSLFDDDEFEPKASGLEKIEAAPVARQPELVDVAVKAWDRGQEQYVSRLQGLETQLGDTEGFFAYDHWGNAYARWKMRADEPTWSHLAARAASLAAPLMDGARITMVVLTWDRPQVVQKDFFFDGVNAQPWERSLPRDPKE